jgi:LytS/YehU family sensor histidine kinase
MLSQLQPHFLFNALMAIQDKCHGKAPEAEEMVVEFAEYLRGNLDSLRRREPVPFRQELGHTKNYLALENKRFPGKIGVEYYIESEEFLIPSLTLQPVVENAVRYGITQREEGGTVKIYSRDTGSAYQVVVEDDGVGFDINATKPDGRTHIGIDSIRRRLSEMCGGSLEAESTPNVGTKVTITIPKQGGAAV